MPNENPTDREANRSESRRTNDEGRALSERLLKCPYCGGEGRLGTSRNDFLVSPCRCDCGAEKLVLPDGSIALQHRPCGNIMTFSDRRDDLMPYSIMR
ncbi:MAG: hypothetical protein WB643_02405 [Candidatus Bathyarchaeia archaeon]